MKKKSLFCGLMLLACCLINPVFAQNTPLPEYLKKLDVITSNLAQEKIYLHLDKPYYAVGDNIWFKVYTLNAKTGQPSITSGLVYVELINEKDSIDKKMMLPLRGGITWGDFKLADSLTEGNYRIRAYTQWMRNAGPEFFYDKTIKIGNSWANKVFTNVNYSIVNEASQQKIIASLRFSDKQNLPYTDCPVSYELKLNNKTLARGKSTTSKLGDIVVEALNKQPDLLKEGHIEASISLPNKQVVKKVMALNAAQNSFDVQFFPEGGKMVEGLPNRIGVKAINGRGLGEPIKAKVINSDGVEIAKFESNKLGMCSFFINPLPNQVYKAEVEFANGSKKTYNLPQVEKSGVVLAVSNQDSTKLNIRLFLSPDLLNKADYNLIAHHNGLVYFSSAISSSKQVVSLSVPKDSLPSGVLQISLLTQDYKPLSERLVFINNFHDKIQLDSEGLLSHYPQRGKVAFDVKASNRGQAVQGSFSVAVTNTSAVKPDLENESNILSRMLLTADLSGYVEKPNYYFLDQGQDKRQDLDALLLTQGWRKIEWKKIADSKVEQPRFAAEKKIVISGTVTKGGKPVVKGKIMLVSFTGGFFATDTLTDEKGRFSFDQIEFTDSTKFVVQARTQKDRKFVDIVMDVVPGQVVTKNPNTGDMEVNVNQSMLGYLNESNRYFDDQVQRGLLNRTILLDEVKVVEKRKPSYESSNIGGAGHADAVFHAKDLETSFSLSQFLQGRVAGVQIYNGQAFARGSTEPMKISVDGMMLEGEDVSLDEIVVADIQTVEVLKSGATTAIYGSRGGSGVIVITTKRGEGYRSVNPYTPGLIKYNPLGYAMVREFYSPKYDVKEDSRPDLRTTVFWEPQLVTDKEGKANISYFNTDVPGLYRIVIEGVDVDGNLARKVLSYRVN